MELGTTETMEYKIVVRRKVHNGVFNIIGWILLKTIIDNSIM